MDINSIPLSIRPYLLEIAERLWTGHASVMVGAGFSKNAINKADQQKGMPNWNELGDIFYEKIHGQAPSSHSKYLNALKLADEVQAAFGRSILEQILKQHIPDKDFEPSDTHIKLLELPWSDVFTTNYDTLLERSCENVISRRYDVVLNQNDIIYSNRPRIVKLHGSFPSERPFIVTEEDYRVYPKRFAPFVNTVQQSLLENTLCLIGFSGDDPNFLQWIGWINDNIGKDNSPKIYLIGILNLSEAQKNLLATKNIVPIDLSVLLDGEPNHKKAIDLLLAFLFKQRTSRENLQWGINSPNVSFQSTSITEVTEMWKKERTDYPNWIICPQENRERLWGVTNQYVKESKIWDDLSSPLDLEFIYELNWRFEKCLFPLYNDHVQFFESILNKYRPDQGNAKVTNLLPQPYTDHRKQLRSSEIQQKWIHLMLSLLRFYREEGFNDKWEINQEALENIKGTLSLEQNAWFHYERVLMSIFRSDIEGARTVLQEWPANEYNPFWDAKRAMLLAEFGFLEESYSVLEKCLTTVRKRLNLTPVANDYKWVSQEAYLMFQFRLIRNNVRHSKGIYEPDDELGAFNERWNSLLQFKCSPWQEQKHFDTILQHTYIPKLSKSVNEGFEIGNTSTSYLLGAVDSEVITAYNYLRFVEELGAPLSLQLINFNDKTVKGALERIYPYSPSWALAMFTRSRNKDLADVVFNRLSLSKLDYKAVDKLSLDYLNRYTSLTQTDNKEQFAKSFLRKVPIALSRLCVKCSKEVKLKIFKFYIEASKGDGQLEGLDKLWNTLLASSNDEIKTEIIPYLFEMPLINDGLKAPNPHFKEPFEHFNVSLTKYIIIDKIIINDLMKKAEDFDNLRKRSITRLMFLYRHNLLEQEEIERFFSTIWAHTDANGFPTDINYYYFAFINWPHPNGEDVLEVFKRYILNKDFTVQGKNKGVSMNGGHDRYAEEVLHGSSNINGNKGVNWISEDIEVIIDKCVKWWASDKHYLMEDLYKDESFGGSVYDEFLSRFKLLVNIIARVFGHQRSVLTEESKDKIVCLINDMEKCKVPVLKAKIAFSDSLNYPESVFIKELEANIICNNKAMIVDALEAAAIGIFYFDKRLKQESVAEILDIIVQPLKWRNFELSKDCLLIIENILANKKECFPFVKPVVLAALDYLYNFTDTKLRDNEKDESVAEILLLRQQAMKLANTIHKIEEDNVPEVLIKWQHIANDPNEFGEITSHWNSQQTESAISTY